MVTWSKCNGLIYIIGKNQWVLHGVMNKPAWNIDVELWSVGRVAIHKQGMEQAA